MWYFNGFCPCLLKNVKMQQLTIRLLAHQRNQPDSSKYCTISELDGISKSQTHRPRVLSLNGPSEE